MSSFNPLDRVVFVQHTLKFAPPSSQRLTELGLVSSNFRDTVANYGEAIFDCWRRKNPELFDEQFRAACTGVGLGLNFVPQMLAAGASLDATALAVPADRTFWHNNIPVIAAAASRGHVEIVAALVAAGAGVEDAAATNLAFTHSALVCAAANGHVLCVKFLLAAGASIDAANSGKTALWAAIDRDHVDCARVLLDAGASAIETLFSVLLEHPPHINHAGVSCVRALVRLGADVNAADDDRTTALMVAARWAEPGHANVHVVELLKTFLSLGADADLEDDDGNTALSLADGEDCQHLLRRSMKSLGWTPLLVAAEAGDVAGVAAALESGEDVNAALVRDNAGTTALLLAAQGGHTECLRLLASAGADLEAEGVDAQIEPRECNRTTALESAAYWGHADAAVALLELGAAVGTSLRLVVGLERPSFHDGQGRLEIVKALVAAGADVQARDGHGATALFDAAWKRDFEMCELLLLEGRADIDVPNNDGVTALAEAASCCNTKMVMFLLEHGARADVASNDGRTALHRAAYDVYHIDTYDEDLQQFLHVSHADCVRAVLAHCVTERHGGGAILDLQDNGGATALFLAARRGFLQCVEALVDSGADLDVMNNDGETARSIAEKFEHGDCVEALDAARKNAGSRRARVD